jgi:hypothetical protein
MGFEPCLVLSVVIIRLISILSGINGKGWIIFLTELRKRFPRKWYKNMKKQKRMTRSIGICNYLAFHSLSLVETNRSLLLYFTQYQRGKKRRIYPHPYSLPPFLASSTLKNWTRNFTIPDASHNFEYYSDFSIFDPERVIISCRMELHYELSKLYFSWGSIQEVNSRGRHERCWLVSRMARIKTE